MFKTAFVVASISFLTFACAEMDQEVRTPAHLIKEEIQSESPAIKGCYEEALLKDSSLEGKVVISLEVGAEGEVREVAFEENDLEAPQMEDCLLDVAMRWHFEGVKAGTKVRYPFIFRNDEAPPSSLSAGTIRAGMQGLSPRLSGCYEEGLRTNPQLHGEVVAVLVVSEHGEVVDASLDEITLESPPVCACLLETLVELRLPVSTEGTTIRYPLVFHADET